MQEGMQFRFELPQQPQGPVVEISLQEAEKTLLKKVEAEKSQPLDALWELASFYQQTRQFDKGLDCLRQILPKIPDAERRASCVLGFGQMMESIGDYKAAVSYYKEALPLEPVRTATWYFINNNLGFSLNQLGEFRDGEKYCRKAIEIDPNRPNGFKNLGLALLGQEDFHGAATCFVSATQVNAADPRSLRYLEELVKQHPELEFEFQDKVESCRKAVEAVSKKAEELKPVIVRGWRKYLFLLRVKVNRLLSHHSGRA
jgi:tetratricopeptide (TPR) repeat protein